LRNEARLNVTLWRNHFRGASIILLISGGIYARVINAAENFLPRTKPLQTNGDISAQMREGIGHFLDCETELSIARRKQFWAYDFSSRENFEKSITPNRERLKKIIGVVDKRLPVKALEYISNTETPAKIAEAESFSVFSVRWPVFPGVFGEGLWLKPKGETKTCVIVLPDADQTPEMLAGLAQSKFSPLARRLAEQGCQVIVPALISRDDTFSGNPKIHRFTNQPHREWVYRQAFEMGRHVIGYEVQTTLAAVDFFSASAPDKKIGLAGVNEGALIAFYSAALDIRIDSVLVSGYFDSRQQLWQEPIYRNVFGLLNEFGDSEIATMIAPRNLIIENSPVPAIEGPPNTREGRHGAAPGKISTPNPASVTREIERCRALLKNANSNFQKLKFVSNGENGFTDSGPDAALTEWLHGLQVEFSPRATSDRLLTDLRKGFNPTQRQQRLVNEWTEFTQQLCRDSAERRSDFFWKHVNVSSPEALAQSCEPLKEYFWREVIGRLSVLTHDPNTRSRKILEKDKWTGYEIALDVNENIFAWGILLLPKDIKPGERRPVVVCQHGLEGVPIDIINDDPKLQPFPYYNAFAARLAEEGFVVFAPHNPYRGGDSFRVLQRKANPLKKSLFSVIIAQHQQILNWLSQQTFVDASRIGFYGLSYGGKTAMRVPALLDGYALSICSGDFNDWIQKNVSVDYPASYMFTGEYEMPEFDLGDTFNYAEMAALIAPRPFMVERGHTDGVAPDTWVASEYSKVRRLYAQLGLPERTRIEFFNGPHTINGIGTFEFLHEQLRWPEGKTSAK
jgi:dienelactone hydrolase